MFFLLLRLAPWLLALLAALVSWWQWRMPSFYPWPLLLVVIGYGLSAGGLIWRSKHWREGLRTLWPTCVVLLVVGFGHLLIEEASLRWLTTIIFTFVPWLALRLGWLLLYESNHYPSQAFCRFYLALAPICFWYVFATLQGIQVFLLPTLSSLVLGACLLVISVLAGTVRSWRDIHEREWFWVSLLVGAHAIILLLLMPTNMAVHGALAALLIAIPLRFKQLSQNSTAVSSRAWWEGGLFATVWIGICVSARWI